VQAWADSSPDSRQGDEDHFGRLARLLDLESQAEAREATDRGRRLSSADAERAGTSLVDLVVADEDTGLGGRYLVQLVKRSRSPLPWTRLKVGSPVVLSPQAAKDPVPYRGVIYQRAESSLHVALGSMPDDLDEHDLWRLDLSSDEVAVERQRTALQRARSARGDRVAELRDVLLGQRQPEFGPEQDEPALDPGSTTPAGGGAVRPLVSRRGADSRSARDGQDDRRGRADPPGSPPW